MNAIAMKRLFGNLAVLIAAILWGTTGTAATFAPDVSAIAIGAVAMGGGGLLQALVAFRSIHYAKNALFHHWRYVFFGALAVAVYPLAFYASMRLAGVTIGTVITIGSAPLLSALIEYRMDGLRLTTRWIIGALFGLTGMILLCFAESVNHTEMSSSLNVIIGITLGLLAGLTYAIYSWTARRLMLRHIPSRAAMGATFGLGGILLLPVLLMTGTPLLASWSNAAVGMYMAIIPMFLGYLCYGYGLARVSASTATTITLFEPVIAACLAMIIVGETLPFLGWIGIALILVCLICITLPIKTRVQPQSSNNVHLNIDTAT